MKNDKNCGKIIKKQVGHKALNILVACEESQAVTKELRNLGHNAYSCDLLECSGGKPQWHFNIDVFEVIENKGGKLQNGDIAQVEEWDMMIAHPPCTYLAVSGARWFYDPITGNEPHPRFKNRRDHQKEAIDFFTRLWQQPIKKIAIENPIGIMSSQEKVGKPAQIVHPWMFGDEASKATCLWLKSLPPLIETKRVEKGKRVFLRSGKSLPEWYSDALTKSKSAEERRTMRSKTFQGMAKAMAEQWTKA
jgi:hypothetical protein